MNAVDAGLVDAALVERVRMRLAAEPAGPGADSTASRVASVLRSEGRVLGGTAMLGVVAAVRSEMSGLGLLQPLLDDPSTTDVLVHGAGEVWVDRGNGLLRTPLRFADDGAVRRLAQRLAAGAGRRLDDAAPFVDARLPGGIRMHAVLAPVASSGTCLSLRVASRRAFTLAGLVDAGSLPPRGADLLQAMVDRRLSTLVTGAAGTGKTTVLAALLGCVAPSERIVLVEDSGELAPDHPHVVHLEARPPNLEGAGAITLRELLRQALRMRPDRLVVGEVRGSEVLDLLAALNTGHDGGFGTLHANSVADVPARLEALALAAGLGRQALHSQVAAGVDAVVHLGRDGDGRRRVVAVGLPRRMPSDESTVEVEPAVTFARGGAACPGPAAERLSDLVGSARCPW
jgi:pilus assembly protein CpaF